MSVVPFLPYASPATHPWKQRWLGTRRYLLGQLAAGLVVTAPLFLALATQPANHYPHGPLIYLGAMVLLLNEFFLLHLFRVVLLYYRQQRLAWPALLVRVALWSVPFTIAYTGSYTWIQTQWAAPEELATSIAKGDYSLHSVISFLSLELVFLAAWIGVYCGAHFFFQFQRARLERAQLDGAFKEAQLEALKAQINPHFLFNCLNTVRALVPRELNRPRDAITLLSEILRVSLTIDHSRTILLSRELETVDSYLALEHLRFERRLQIRRQIDPVALDWKIPPFLLQTLVENALKHGIAQCEEGGEVGIEANVCADILHLCVTNPGRLSPPTSTAGLGLKNARARLALLFGGKADLRLTQRAKGLFAAEVFIPRNEQLASL